MDETCQSFSPQTSKYSVMIKSVKEMKQELSINYDGTNLNK